MLVQTFTQKLESKRDFIMKKLQNPELFDHVRKHAVEVELPMIEAALVRITDGDYETCLDCGENIEPDRLAAIPEIATCKSCGFRRDGRDARRS